VFVLPSLFQKAYEELLPDKIESCAVLEVISKAETIRQGHDLIENIHLGVRKI
jgi:hypothetical protein